MSSCQVKGLQWLHFGHLARWEAPFGAGFAWLSYAAALAGERGGKGFGGALCHGRPHGRAGRPRAKR